MDSKLTIIEKVIFLQEVDIFEYTTTDDLSIIASIATEHIIEEGRNIYSEGEYSDAMYLVIEGNISVHQDKREIATFKDKEAFGTWSLFDDELRVATATCSVQSKLLKIDKEDFFELLSQNVRITQGILKKLSRRIRSLMSSFTNKNNI